MNIPNAISCKQIGVIVFSWSLFGGNALANIKLHEFGIDGRAILCVPESDMDPWLLNFNDESLYLQVGPGETPGFGFLFDSARMKRAFTSYRTLDRFNNHPYVNNLSGTIGFVGELDEKRYGPSMRAINIEDIWYKRGSCSKPIIDKIPGTALYGVMCTAMDGFYSIWDRAPDSENSIPYPDEFVVATCERERISIGKYAGADIHSCSRILVFDEFIVDYRFQKTNAGLVGSFDLMLRGKILEWKSNCGVHEKVNVLRPEPGGDHLSIARGY